MATYLEIRVRVRLPFSTRLGLKCLVLLARCRVLPVQIAFRVGEAWIRRTVHIEAPR